MMSLILFGSFFVLLIFGVPIAISLGVSSLFGFVSMGFSFETIATLLYASITKFSLLAIPFFILAGLIMEKAEISSRLIRLAEVLLGKSRYNLVFITVVVACFFAAISGSGPATVAAVGTVLIPAMTKRGYGRDLPPALMSASGSIGIIIPPSIPFVIYATLAEVSVTRMFLAGVTPGLLMGVCYTIAAVLLLRKNSNLKPAEESFSWSDKWDAFKDAFWGLLTPVIILGGIYGGIFTPTEAAGIAIIYGLFVGICIYRTIKIKQLFKVLVDSAVQSAVVMFIVACAGVFGWLLTTSLVARTVSGLVLSLTTNKIALLVLMNIILLIAGCFLDTISAMYILIPIMMPIIKTIGVDPIHFGVFLTVNLAIGQFTPPVGANLYVACNIANQPLESILRKIVPFVIAGIIGLLVVTYIPQITLWLPNLAMG